MSAPLVERLREALRGHAPYYGNQPTSHYGHVLGCNCGTRWTGFPPSEFNAHLARVSARVVEAWLGEQRETVAEATIQRRRVVPDSFAGTDCHLDADAVVDALRAGIGAES